MKKVTASLSSPPHSFSRLFYYKKFRPKRTDNVHLEKGSLCFSQKIRKYKKILQNLSSSSALPLGVKWVITAVAEELPPRDSPFACGAEIGACAFLIKHEIIQVFQSCLLACELFLSGLFLRLLVPLLSSPRRHFHTSKFLL